MMKTPVKNNHILLPYRFAIGLHKALKKSKVKSFGKLAKIAGIEPAQMQKISCGMVDVPYSVSIAIADALGITPSEFFSYPEKISEKQAKAFFNYLRNPEKFN